MRRGEQVRTRVSVRHASLQAVVSGLGFFLSATESHQRVINMLVM